MQMHTGCFQEWQIKYTTLATASKPRMLLPPWPHMRAAVFLTPQPLKVGLQAPQCTDAAGIRAQSLPHCCHCPLYLRHINSSGACCCCCCCCAQLLETRACTCFCCWYCCCRRGSFLAAASTAAAVAAAGGGGSAGSNDVDAA